eukprot:303153-Rhodomonas_salina.1
MSSRSSRCGARVSPKSVLGVSGAATSAALISAGAGAALIAHAGVVMGGAEPEKKLRFWREVWCAGLCPAASASA